MTGRRARGPRVRTVFIGSGGFGLPAFRALATHPAIDLVGARSARLHGRRVAVSPHPRRRSRTRRAALGVTPVLTPIRLRDPDAVDEVLGLDPSLVVLADYGRIVPAALLGPAARRTEPPSVVAAAASRRDAGPGHDPRR